MFDLERDVDDEVTAHLRREQSEREIQQWCEQVLSVPSERTLNLGRNAWRYYFHRNGEPCIVPLYSDPLSGNLWAVLPEDIDDVQITYSVKVPERGL